ncbi:hypothetical protein [Stackebrandtia soli]|uniref:hypothetical protein n=1 Tax=Stackebrandtia soli TaxID=1892856 RepID=UPI0039E8A15E
MTTLEWNLDVEPVPVVGARSGGGSVVSLLTVVRPEPGERDPHKERLGRERERDAAREARRARYPIPEPDPTGTAWDRLGWRERVLNAHRARVDAALTERRKRDQTPALVVHTTAKPDRRPEAGTVDGPEPAFVPVEKHNRDHWRDFARRILDDCAPDDDGFDWWGTKPRQAAPDSDGDDSRTDASTRPLVPPTRPFEFRRPNATRPIGRATVYSRQSRAFRTHPPIRPTTTHVVQAPRDHTRTPPWRGETRTVQKPMNDPEPIRVPAMASMDDAGTVHEDGASTHVPRWNPIRRMLLWLFGTRLINRPYWWAKTCRDCRTEWPCRTLVHELHQRYATLGRVDTAARHAELEHLSHTRRRSSRGRPERGHRRPAPRHLTPTLT